MSRLEGLWRWPARIVPELHGLPPRRQRVLWREAVSRSAKPRRVLVLLAIRFAGSIALAELGHMLWPGVSVSLVAVVGLIASGVISDLAITRQAARCWLREHAHELDRYAAP